MGGGQVYQQFCREAEAEGYTGFRAQVSETVAS